MFKPYHSYRILTKFPLMNGDMGKGARSDGVSSLFGHVPKSPPPPHHHQIHHTGSKEHYANIMRVGS